MSKIILVHGWDGSPEDDWLPWIKTELESKGNTVLAPEMPDTEQPKIDLWVNHLNETIGTPDENTYLVGHSIGCQTILRYLAGLPEDARVGGVLFVAGWVHLTPESFPDEASEQVAQPWLNTPINWEQAKKHTDTFVALFSEDDPYVPISDAEIFKDKLGAKVIIENAQGHYSLDTNKDAIDNPTALQELLNIIK